jgi:hypothetical protein
LRAGSCASGRRPSVEPFRKFYDDPFRAAEVAEPIDVFVALDLANQLPAVGSHTGDGGVLLSGDLRIDSAWQNEAGRCVCCPFAARRDPLLTMRDLWVMRAVCVLPVALR